jgi:hypothetical protein
VIFNKYNILCEGGKLLEYKICTKCKKSLPATDEYFYLQKTKRKNGYKYVLKSACKECERKDSYEDFQRIRVENPEYRKGTRRKHYLKYRDEQIQYAKDWYKENAEEQKVYRFTYMRNNPDKLAQYRENHKHKIHKITEKEWLSCKQYFNFQCAYCGMSEKEHYELHNQQLSKEHVINEGNNDLSNCVPACKICNSEKSANDIDDWYNEQNLKYDVEKYNKIMEWLSADYLNYLQ